MRANNDLDVISVLQSILKLKASVSALINDDANILKKAKYNYFGSILLHTDTEEENEFKSSDKVLQFLEHDYRKDLHSENKDSTADLNDFLHARINLLMREKLSKMFKGA